MDREAWWSTDRRVTSQTGFSDQKTRIAVLKTIHNDKC